MSLTDAFIEVVCDSCLTEERIELCVRYSSYGNVEGHYSTDEVPDEIAKLGWSEDGDEHKCSDCKEK